MSTPKKVEKVCVDCGTVVTYSYDHVRKKPDNYPWRCKSCMSKYRSKLMESSPNSIGEIVKKKMENPETRDAYKEDLSKRARSLWDSMTADQKASHIDAMHKGLEMFYANASDNVKAKKVETLKKYYASRTEEESQQHKQKLKASRKRYISNLSEKDKKQMQETGKKSWEDKTDEEKSEYSKRSASQWKTMSLDEYSAVTGRMAESQKKWWENAQVDEVDKRIESIRNGIANMSEDSRESIRQAGIDRWANMTDEEKYKKLRMTFIVSNGRNNFNKKFEKAFAESYLSNSFYLIPEYTSSNDEYSHSWDYGVFDENGDLVMVVDLDGAYFHADNTDYDGIHSKEEYDEKRMLSVSGNIMAHIIYENKFADSFKEMIKLLINGYDSFVNSMLEYCRSTSFPYPKYSKDELMKSWKTLERMDCTRPYINLSTNTRLGDRIITHFHPSIYHAYRSGCISPYDAWYNDKLLKKVIENRIIYANALNPNKILQGFNASKIAPKVSVFSAGRAKFIISRYLSEYDEIFDPFSGFGGRMLGTASLGKKYVGQDISDRYIKENQDIVDFLGINDLVSLKCRDIFLSSGTYECLFTCPPYEDKEFWTSVNPNIRTCDDWIDECIKRFKCKKYLFVIDHTSKYIDNVVGTIENKSHFGINKEEIVEIKGG